MRKICLISHCQLAMNPRMVRDANTFVESGYSVDILTPRYDTIWASHEKVLTDNARWSHKSVDFLASKAKVRYWNYVRFRRRLSALMSNAYLNENLVARAIGYANPELTALAVTNPADLYIAYQHPALPAAARAAQLTNSKFACDAQDLLADSSAEPVALIRYIEQRYLKQCAYVSTMSRSASQRLRDINHLAEQPFVLHNTPNLSERAEVLAPENRKRNTIPSLYWFGITLGPHSCAEQVLRAMPLLQQPVQLVLRGNPIESYVNEIVKLAEELKVRQYLKILPPASPQDMVKLAAEHDIVLGTQPSKELFHQMAVGNKVFTGMMAGLALALTDTIAHRDLLSQAEGCGFVFSNGDEKGLAEKLNELLACPEQLQEMKQCSWDLSQQKFNWSQESKALLAKVRLILHS